MPADPELNTALLDALRQTSSFRLLCEEQLERLAAISRLRRFSASELIFSAGEPARFLPVVVSGKVRLYRSTPDGRERVLHYLGAGRSFAEAALLSMEVFPASAAAMVTPTEVLIISGEPFLELFRGDSKLAASMVGALSIRLHELADRIEELSIPGTDGRLARRLLEFPARGVEGRLVVEFPLAKKDLAAELATTPETLSRLLRRFQERGWIESRRSEVVILDVEALLALADGSEA